MLVSIGSLALLANAGLIFYRLPAVFGIKDKDNTVMYFGGIMTAGTVTLGFLML